MVYFLMVIRVRRMLLDEAFNEQKRNGKVLIRPPFIQLLALTAIPSDGVTCSVWRSKLVLFSALCGLSRHTKTT